MKRHIKHIFLRRNPHIMDLRIPGITRTVFEFHQTASRKSLKVRSNSIDSCLNPVARRPQCHFLSQGRWRRLMEQNSPSCPSQITTKHLISIPHSVPFLLCSAAVHQHPGAAMEAGRGRKERVRKRRRDARKACNERGRKGRQGGSDWQGRKNGRGS